jgi:hypothetical protein
MAARKKSNPPKATPPKPIPAPITQLISVRFEATLGSAPYAKAVKAAAEFDLDRLPDARGKVTLLLSPDDARRLLEYGFEVHLTAAIPVGPLDQRLVMTDEQAKRSLERQLKGIPRKGGR